MKLGTILPTRAELAAADSHADRETAKRVEIGNRIFGSGAHFVRDGEHRWHIYGECRYAVIGRGGRPQYFEQRPDGDYAVGAKR
jgi:hypothetical protein